MCIVNAAPPQPSSADNSDEAAFTLAAPVSRIQGQYGTYYPYGQNPGFGQQGPSYKDTYQYYYQTRSWPSNPDYGTPGRWNDYHWGQADYGVGRG